VIYKRLKKLGLRTSRNAAWAAEHDRWLADHQGQSPARLAAALGVSPKCVTERLSQLGLSHPPGWRVGGAAVVPLKPPPPLPGSGRFPHSREYGLPPMPRRVLRVVLTLLVGGPQTVPQLMAALGLSAAGERRTLTTQLLSYARHLGLVAAIGGTHSRTYVLTPRSLDHMASCAEGASCPPPAAC
jgi:hypothetical protein